MRERNWVCIETVGFKKAYDSVRRDVLYNIPIELGVPMKLVRLKSIVPVTPV
jgi:hypothetical protein